MTSRTQENDSGKQATGGIAPMDFDQAINAHMVWKKKLKAYLAKPDGSLQPWEVAREDICELGRWILNESVRFSHYPEFATLKGCHARFHQAAAQLVARCETDPAAIAETELGANSDFTTATSAVVLSLIAMKKRAGQ